MSRFLCWISVVALALIFSACSFFAYSAPQPKPFKSPRPVEYGYPAVYRVKSIKEQVSVLRENFSELQRAEVAFVTRYLGGVPIENFDEIWLPFHIGDKPAEGLFAIPQWQKLAPTYGEAIEKVFAALAKQRPFYNWRKGKLDPEYLRQFKHKTEAWKELAASQNNADILLVPAQFGLRHHGKSVQQVRALFAEADNEFGLGAYEVGIMLLTHPERFQIPDDIRIDAPGDEYSYYVDGVFSLAPFFSFHGGEVRFSARWFGDANEDYGSASAFLSQ